ncbi:hypothetical protein METP3_00399 [Methanosarcinales archaeon]|nr:hypothetical protein METP3_00399 [Methanosarcinales archaeon]
MKSSGNIRSIADEIMKREHQITAPLEKAIKIILTSFECGYHALNLRSSAFICGSFLISVTEYSNYLIAIKKNLESKLSQRIFRLFYGISIPIDNGAETLGG